MSLSSLATIKIPAAVGNYMKGRGGSKIQEVTIHHMAGNLSVEGNGAMWQQAGKQVSSHYGVNLDKIGGYVDENDTAYCNGNSDANKRAITIEVANDASVTGKTYAETTNKGNDQGWPVDQKSIDTLVKLLADIGKRHGLVYVPGKTLTWHNLFRPTICPGPFLQSKIPEIADRANALIQGTQPSGKLYGVMKQVIALSDKSKADSYAKQLNSLGEKDAYYKVLEVIK